MSVKGEEGARYHAGVALTRRVRDVSSDFLRAKPSANAQGRIHARFLHTYPSRRGTKSRVPLPRRRGREKVLQRDAILFSRSHLHFASESHKERRKSPRGHNEGRKKRTCAIIVRVRTGMDGSSIFMASNVVNNAVISPAVRVANSA